MFPWTESVDVDQLAKSSALMTRLVSIMTANMRRVIQPSRNFADCRSGRPLHSVYGSGVRQNRCDLSLVDAASFAATQVLWRRARILFLRSGLSIQPIMFGGAHENERRRTENVAAIAGMAAAEWTQRDLARETGA